MQQEGQSEPNAGADDALAVRPRHAQPDTANTDPPCGGAAHFILAKERLMLGRPEAEQRVLSELPESRLFEAYEGTYRHRAVRWTRRSQTLFSACLRTLVPFEQVNWLLQARLPQLSAAANAVATACRGQGDAAPRGQEAQPEQSERWRSSRWVAACGCGRPSGRRQSCETPHDKGIASQVAGDSACQHIEHSCAASVHADGRAKSCPRGWLLRIKERGVLRIATWQWSALIERVTRPGEGSDLDLAQPNEYCHGLYHHEWLAVRGWGGAIDMGRCALVMATGTAAAPEPCRPPGDGERDRCVVLNCCSAVMFHRVARLPLRCAANTRRIAHPWDARVVCLLDVGGPSSQARQREWICRAGVSGDDAFECLVYH